jgi:hypothetical protein
MQYVTPKRWCLLTNPHGVTIQKTNIEILNELRILEISGWLSSGLLRRVVWWKFTDISEVLIALMIEEANTSEASVNFYQTKRRNNPDDIHL